MTEPPLVPAVEKGVRCATLSRRLGVDPGGSALEVDEIIVVDVALPWPKPVWRKPLLDQIPNWVDSAWSSGRSVRVVASVPDRPEQGFAGVVVHRRPSGSGLFLATPHRTVTESMPGLVRRLLVDGLDSSPETVRGEAAPREEILVCTQGSHDICCGTHGVGFAATISSRAPQVSVRRVSHIGGHRFAPTALTLPDGRMWGLLDAEQMLGIIDRSAAPSSVVGFCRGWTGTTQGPAQMAERAVWAEIDDWSWDQTDRSVDVMGVVDGVTTCIVSGGGRSWRVEIAPGRELQVITCGSPGGQPTKPGLELVVRSLTRVD